MLAQLATGTLQSADERSAPTLVSALPRHVWSSCFAGGFRRLACVAHAARRGDLSAMQDAAPAGAGLRRKQPLE